jgi:hypothetical protein
MCLLNGNSFFVVVLMMMYVFWLNFKNIYIYTCICRFTLHFIQIQPTATPTMAKKQQQPTILFFYNIENRILKKPTTQYTIYITKKKFFSSYTLPTFALSNKNPITTTLTLSTLPINNALSTNSAAAFLTSPC